MCICVCWWEISTKALHLENFLWTSDARKLSSEISFRLLTQINPSFSAWHWHEMIKIKYTQYRRKIFEWKSEAFKKSF